MYFIGDLSAVHLALHYGISNHVHHSCLLLSYINVIMQIIHIKDATYTCVVLILYHITLTQHC